MRRRVAPKFRLQNLTQITNLSRSPTHPDYKLAEKLKFFSGENITTIWNTLPELEDDTKQEILNSMKMHEGVKPEEIDVGNSRRMVTITVNNISQSYYMSTGTSRNISTIKNTWFPTGGFNEIGNVIKGHYVDPDATVQDALFKVGMEDHLLHKIIGGTPLSEPEKKVSRPLVDF